MRLNKVQGWGLAALISLGMWALIIWGVQAFAQTLGVQVVVAFDSAERVQARCSTLTGRDDAVACGSPALIIAPDPCDYRGRYAEIMCHEITCHVSTGRADHDAEGCVA